MKKFLPLFLGFLFIAIIIKAQYVAIPDDNFRNFLLAKYPSCFNNVGELNVSCSTIATEDSLDISGIGIVNLEGIEYFTSLVYLNCSSNFIEFTQPPFSSGPDFPNTIKYLDFSKQTSLDDPFGSLPSRLPDSLTYFDCSGSGEYPALLMQLPALPAKLITLKCSNVGLGSLPDLPNSLVYLDCSNQVNYTLTSSPRCLGGIPTLPKSLQYLDCSSNAIGSLPTLPDSLKYLNCLGMGFSDINHNFSYTLFCLPQLPNGLTSLQLPASVTCIKNIVPGIGAILPVCNPSNDVNHCQGFPIISGNIFYDNNSNNTKDSSELYTPNVQLKLSDGVHIKYTSTDNEGYYQISPDSIGNYTLSVNPPSHYKAMPDSINYSFSRYDTAVAPQKIALQPTVNLDSLKIAITPYDHAWPGLDIPYFISYTNVGTTTLTATVVFNYVNTLLTYDSSTNTSVINNGTNISLGNINLAPGQSGNFIATFTVNSTAIPYEIAFTNATITANNISASDSNASTILGTNYQNGNSQYAVIPDDSLRKFLLHKYPSCFNNIGELNTICSTVLNEDSLNLSSIGVANLEGVEYFTSLTYLNCANNPLEPLGTQNIFNSSALMALPNTIKYLDLSNQMPTDGPFGALPVNLPDALTYFDCSGTTAYSALIFELPALPAKLLTLKCSNIGLSTLPDLPNTLVYLDCSNQVNSTLTYSPRSLSGLPVLPKSLQYLDCSGNAFDILPALPDSLKYLNCSGMGFSDINHNFSYTLFCVPKLPNALTTLKLPESVTCIPNIAPGIGPILPVCDPTNDVNHCQGFPTISGNVFFDGNSNAIKDANEVYTSNIRVQLSNGIHSKYTFTNSGGAYQISPDSIGNYTLTVNAPSYYQSNPASFTYNFGRYDTSITTQNIALQPTALIDSLQINVTPYSQASPGFDLQYLISYKNIGTTTLEANIIFNYVNTLLTYNSSDNIAAVNNGSSISLSAIHLSPGQSGNFITYFTVNPSAIPGEVAFTNAAITANSSTATDSLATIIRGSYDPNDKEATTQLTPEEVAKGKSINYIIHFQNTGNAIAYNIVIADTLSSLLNVNSLQINSSSNPCKVTVIGNVVYFEFLNVLLPDSITNEPSSHGFINFSIQPQSSINSGAINNTASIYFDYNTPVITNTVSTSIQEPNNTVPVTLLSFKALTQSSNSNVLLYWNTTSEINTKTFVLEQSTDGINFTTIATVAAKGYGANTYSYTITDNTATYYRLKMVDNNGQYAYSKIVSVNSTQETEGITILNNPAVSFVMIKNNIGGLNNTVAKIVDSHGATLKTFELHMGTQDVNVNNLPPGGYYIETLTTPLKFIIAK